MCTHLVQAAVEDDWCNYTNSQWRYDSFFNEWDLAMSFDPGASVEDNDNNDMDGFTFWPDTPPPHVMFSQDISSVYRNDASGNEMHNEASDMSIANPESIEDILYYCYGYNWDGMTPFNTS